MAIKDIEEKWNGIINRSALMIAIQVDNYYRKIDEIKANQKYFLILVFSCFCIFAIINKSVLDIFDIRLWVETSNIVVLLLLLLGIIGYYQFENNKKVAQENFQKYKELLMRRIDAGFCTCNTRCNHKEEFMQDMEKDCGIILYY